MNISIKDDQGLGFALMNEGYSSELRQQAQKTIRECFKNAAAKVFQDVLERPLPENIIVHMAISDSEELHGKSAARLASFYPTLSRANFYYFNIREITVKTVINHEESTRLDSTVIHELFHAADLYMLECDKKMFNAVTKDAYDEYDIFSKSKRDANIALLKTLRIFHHYRAEGVAILGESLLMKSKFGCSSYATSQFCSIFKMAMIRAQMMTNGHKEESDSFDKDAFHKAYSVAPIILLQVMDKRGDIAYELAQKALDGLGTGHYDMTENDVKTIMRSALALTLGGFIQGLIMLGDEVAPIRPFLNFCASLQHDGDEDSMKAYELLLLQPKSSDTFDAVMSQIMGFCMSGEELKEMFENFIEKNDKKSSYPQMKEKLSILYSVFKNDNNPDRQRLAQWALTYFFDDEDIIHDEISGIGYVDDMTVIDYAIKLLQKSI